MADGVLADQHRTDRHMAAHHGRGGAPTYRPDIDGLRAIAVLVVVLFHVGVPGLDGGFVGVDVFFVISGYLIGGQIAREVGAGSFSFAEFYVRRVRRILPALLAMLLILHAAAWFLLTPMELREFGKEAVAAAFGLSNIFFYLGGGYFEPAAELKPLLMTWSLGVEEQFYLLFPFVMIAVMRLRPHAALEVLAGLSLVSFLGSLWLTWADPNAAFYLLPTRAWELGIGAVLALWEQQRCSGAPSRPRGARSRRAIEAAAIGGLGLIVAAVLLYDGGYGFPGAFALAPTLGPALLLAVPSSLVNRRLLSLAPMLFTGRISYSLYLWHWPLLYFDRLLTGGANGEGLHPAWLIAASFVFGWLSWRFVEQPLRRRVLPRRTALWRYFGATTAVAALALTLYGLQGLPQRLPAAAQQMAKEALVTRQSACLAPYGATAPRNLPLCVPALPAGAGERVVLLGDSHAASIAPAFKRLAESRGKGFGEMTKASCPPLWGYAGIATARAAHWGDCIAYQQAAFSAVLADPAAREVVLAAYWSSGLSVVPAKGGEPIPLALALDITIKRLQRAGKRVVVMQDVPMFAFDPYARVIGDAMPLRRLTTDALAGEDRAADGASSELRIDTSREVIAELVRNNPGVVLVDPRGKLCQDGGCRYRGTEGLYYYDYQHLTVAGGARVLGISP